MAQVVARPRVALSSRRRGQDTRLAAVGVGASQAPIRSRLWRRRVGAAAAVTDATAAATAAAAAISGRAVATIFLAATDAANAAASHAAPAVLIQVHRPGRLQAAQTSGARYGGEARVVQARVTLGTGSCP